VSTLERDAATIGPSELERHAERLDPGDFGSWDDLVSRSPHGTIFQYSWWLEATGYEFEILVSRDRNGKVLAGIPLPRKKKGGMKLFHSPPLTPYLGPVFDLAPAAKLYQRASIMRSIGECLAREVKGFDSLSYVIGAAGPDLQGFLWSGFRAELAYTFRLDPGLSPERTLERADPTHRNKLAKAERHNLVVDTGANIDAFMQLNKKTFQRQNIEAHYSEALARRLWSEASKRGQARIYLAKSTDGGYSAGLLVVNDLRTSYQLLAGGDAELRRLGGGNLVAWRAIRDAHAAGRTYDFEGSAIRGVEQHYRHWGATPMPVWRLTKSNSARGALVQFLMRRRNSNPTK